MASRLAQVVIFRGIGGGGFIWNIWFSKCVGVQ